MSEAAPDRHARVLVVDDNEDAAELLALALEALGYVVAVAPDALQALKIAGDLAPDIALLDIGLPVMDGYELAERLTAQHRGAFPLRLVALSGYGQEADRERSMAAGFRDHLVKPVELEAIVRILATLSSEKSVS